MINRDGSCALTNDAGVKVHARSAPTRAGHENRAASQTACSAEQPVPASLVFANTAYLHEKKGSWDSEREGENQQGVVKVLQASTAIEAPSSHPAGEIGDTR